MEYRVLGKTGLKTSVLGFGGFHLLEIPLKEAEYLLGAYLDAGGSYIETAASYGDGESERKIGRSVMHRRDDFVLVSKTMERGKAEAAAEIDRTLRNLNTGYLDMLLMHAVGTIDELDRLLAEDGAYAAAVEAKKAGKVGHIGISMHGWAGALIEAVKRDRFEAVMATINYYDRFNFPEIEGELLPLANEKGLGMILMKPVGDGWLYQSAEQAFRYAFTRPVSVVVAGINNRQMLKADLKFAESYQPMSKADEEALFMTARELGDYVCRQCGKCSCPRGVDIQEIFAAEGYFDRQMMRGTVQDTAEYSMMERLRFWFGNKELGKARYDRLGKNKKADVCNQCGECIPMCPYGINIPYKLGLADYKLADKEWY
ncbi:MAG: aldo/keto reductase [Oscillospiraceae bacterium]|nr:aldo/keto reductase [Oscillospiraceae bacterium]